MSNQFNIHSSQYNQEYTKEENARFTAAFSEITDAMATAMLAGTPTDSDEVQELIARHYEFVSQFWAPNRESYKSLAMSYILPSPYRDSYENHTPGLGQYHYNAIAYWADRHLPSSKS